MFDFLILKCFDKLISKRQDQLSPATTSDFLLSEVLSRTSIVNVKTKAQVLVLFQVFCNAETNVEENVVKKSRVSSNSNKIDIENRTQWSSRMREEEDEDTEKTGGVRIEADEVTRSVSNVRIENNGVASSKRDIAETEKESGVELGEKEIRDSKRQATEARLARLINERKELETSLAENTQEIERAKRELDE